MALFKLDALVLACCLLVLVQCSEADQGERVEKFMTKVGIPDGYNAVVFRKSESHFPELVDARYNETAVGEHRYGVWTFKCGKFRTGGGKGSDTWVYKGPCHYTIQGGTKVHFQHPDCPDESLRSMINCGFKDGRR